MKQIKRRLFLIEGLSALLAGCQSLHELPKIPFREKEGKSKETLFNVEGSVSEIQTTSDWRFMAIRHRARTWGAVDINQETEPQNNGLDLYNIEFQTPLPCSDISLDSMENPFAVAFTRKGEKCLVASGFQQGCKKHRERQVPIRIEEISLSKKRKETKNSLLQMEDEEWIDLVIAPHGDWFAAQYKDGHWEFRDLNTDPVREVVFPEKYESKAGIRETQIARVLAFSPDGAFAAALMTPGMSDDTRNQTVSIWDLSTARSVPSDKAKKLEALFVSEFPVSDNTAGRICAFSHDGQMFVIRNKEKYADIRQTASGKLLLELGEHKQPITAVQFSPNNTKLVIGTGEEFGRLVLWDVRKGRLLRTFDDPETKSRKITAVQFSPDGSLIYFGNDRGNVAQWEYQ